jgi:hypothetical protein
MMNTRNRLRRAALVLALLALAATITGVAASATTTAMPKKMTGKWNRDDGQVMVVGPRGNVNFLRERYGSKAGWFHTKFSHVTAHRLTISGPRSCSGTATYRWGIARHGTLGGNSYRLEFKKLHDACVLRVELMIGPPDDVYNRPTN